MEVNFLDLSAKRKLYEKIICGDVKSAESVMCELDRLESIIRNTTMVTSLLINTLEDSCKSRPVVYEDH